MCVCVHVYIYVCMFVILVYVHVCICTICMCACGECIHSFQAVLQFLKNALNEKEGEKGKKEGDHSGKERTGN